MSKTAKTKRIPAAGLTPALRSKNSNQARIKNFLNIVGVLAGLSTIVEKASNLHERLKSLIGP